MPRKKSNQQTTGIQDQIVQAVQRALADAEVRIRADLRERILAVLATPGTATKAKRPYNRGKVVGTPSQPKKRGPMGTSSPKQARRIKRYIGEAMGITGDYRQLSEEDSQRIEKRYSSRTQEDWIDHIKAERKAKRKAASTTATPAKE